MPNKANPPNATPEKPRDRDDLETRLPAQLVFALCALVVSVSLGSALYVLLTAKNPSVLQARLSITFACFSIACVIGLLFATTAQKSEAHGKVGVLSLVIIGPGAFFLACLGLYTYLFPEDKIQRQDPMTVTQLSQIVSDADKRSGWIPYSDWKNKLKRLGRLLEQEEESTIEITLGTLYFHGNQNHKLTIPKIQTIFVYGPIAKDGKVAVLKIERISGSWEQDEPEIYYNAKSTTPGNIPKPLLIVRHANDSVEVYGSGKNWAEIRDDPVDCMIVAVYPESIIPDGDIILVDPTKYFVIREGYATVDLVVLSPTRRLDEKLWELRSASTMPQDELPILFREFHSEEHHDSGQMAEDQDVSWWLAELEAEASKVPTSSDNKGEEAQVLKAALDVLHKISPNISFKKLLEDRSFFIASYHLSNLTYPVVKTFLWGSTFISPSPVTSPLDSKE